MCFRAVADAFHPLKTKKESLKDETRLLLL